MAAAVLVLCGAIAGAWQTVPGPRVPVGAPKSSTTGTADTSANRTASHAASTTSTTSTTTVAAAPTPLVTLSTTAPSVTGSHAEETSASGTQEPTNSSSSASSTTPTGSTSASSDSTSASSTTSTSASSTTTTTKPTTTTTTTAAPKPAYPPEWDTVYRSTTEDGLPIEEVTWTYQAAGEKLYLSRYSMSVSPTGSLSRTYTHTLHTRVPMSQCIILTGFDAPTSNGIYRIPAAIDGKVVVGVNMGGNVAGACHFNDPDIAPTVKRIYLPPEMLMIGKNTINQCTALEGIYFGTDTIWIEPEALPATYLYMYSYTLCYMSCSEAPSDLPILKNYCGTIDRGDGSTVSGYYRYYWRATWRSSTFAQFELYHSYGALSPYD